jgi:hypothetical protein
VGTLSAAETTDDGGNLLVKDALWFRELAELTCLNSPRDTAGSTSGAGLDSGASVAMI